MIIKAWNRLSNFGVSEEHPEENDLIRLYNRMSLVSALGTAQVLLIAWFLGFSPTYIFVSSFIVVVYFLTILFNAYGKLQLARYTISVGSPLWISACYFLTGGYFCQGLAIISSMAITYVAFQKKEKIKRVLLIYHILTFFSSIIYVNTFGPILGKIDFPYDELAVFIGGLGWAIIVLYTFDKDRANLVQNLKSNNKELKHTTEELERFTYIASHDLKSPLRTIISFIGLIERDLEKEDYSNMHENLSFVKTGAKQMNFLVEDILELSKLKKIGKSDRIPVDLNLTMEKALQNLKVDIESKNAIVSYKNLPYFIANEVEFLLLFQNFIENGIKYNESKQPVINITSMIKNETLCLSFSDNGIGIDEVYFDQIFQFFKRLHTAKEYQGTGMGLGLCKKIINDYEGEIKIDSQLGVGTTFSIVFPYKEPEKIDQIQVPKYALKT